MLLFSALLVRTRKNLRVDNSASDLPNNGEHFEGTALDETDGLLEKVFGDFLGRRRIHNH